MKSSLLEVRVNGDQIVKFDEFVRQATLDLGFEDGFAKMLFGTDLDYVVENMQAFYQHYQPTRELFSCTDIGNGYVDKFRQDDRYIVTDVSDEARKALGVPKSSDFKFVKVEEKIKYTLKMMAGDVEYNAKLAYVLANTVGQRDIYDVGGGNGVLALGLSLLSTSKITTIESDSRSVELQRALRSHLGNRVRGHFTIENPSSFKEYIERNKIQPSSFIVCSRSEWKLFDEVISFGVEAGTDMFVSRDFHSQEHFLGPVNSAPLEGYEHVRSLVNGYVGDGVKYKIKMALKNKSHHSSHFNEFLIERTN